MFKMKKIKYVYICAIVVLFCTTKIFSQTNKTPSRSNVKTIMGQYSVNNGASGPQNVLITFDYEFFRESLSSGYFLGVRVSNIRYEYLGGAGGKRFKYSGKIYTVDQLQSYDFRGQDCFSEIDIVDATIVGLKVAGFGKNFIIESQLHTIYGLGKISETKDLNDFSITSVGASLNYVKARNTDCIIERISNFEKGIKNRNDYKSTIQKADQAFQIKDWNLAKRYYQQASNIFPNENYPKDQLEKIKEKEEELAKKKELELEKAKVPGATGTAAAGAAKTGSSGSTTGGTASGKSTTEKSGKDVGSDKANNTANGEADKSSEKGSLGKKEPLLNKKDQAEVDAAKKAADDKLEAERKAEEARLEAERVAREEKARLERKENWDKQKKAETAANYDMLEDLSLAAILLHITIAQLTYSDLEMSGPGNIYPDPSLTFDMEFGYGLTYAPLYVDVLEEQNDGNTTTFDESTESSNIFNLDYQFKASFWPVQGQNFGLGFSGGVSGGHGLTFESYNYQMQYGAKAFLGSNTFKVYTEYNLVNRTFIESSWIDSEVSREGKSSGVSHQLKAGLRLNFDVDWETETRAALDILPVFELDQRIRLLNGYGRITQSWANGIEVGLTIDNRIHAYFRTMWNFPIFGENQYPLAATISKEDVFFNFGFVRNLSFIMNNEVLGTVSNVSSLRRMAKEQRPHSIYFLMPSYQYFTTQEGQFNYQPALSVTPIGYGYDYFPIDNFSIGLSGLFTYQIVKMAIEDKSKNIPTGMKVLEAFKIENLNIEVPLSFKYHNTFQSNNNYWLMLGFNNVFTVSQFVTAFSLSENKELYNKSIETNKHLSSIQYGLGCDFNIGDSYFSAGLVYEKGRSNLFEGIDGSKINGIRFLVGAKL